jgi:hypothetical protein
MPWHVKAILFASFFALIANPTLGFASMQIFSSILSTPMILVKYTIFSMVLGQQVECLQMMVFPIVTQI